MSIRRSRPASPSRPGRGGLGARVLATGLLGLLGLSAGTGVAAGPAQAADSCPTTLPAAAMRQATAVFTGVVERSVASSTVTASGKAFVSTVSVDRVYKGTVASSEVEVVTGASACGVGRLKADERYVLMVTVKGDRLVAGTASGTAVATDALLGRLQSVLGAGTPIGKLQVTPDVVLTRVGDVSPTPLLRAAAPGLAVALIGLLGLVVARRFG